MLKNEYIIYDIESYPNHFSIDLKHPVTGQRWIFEINWIKNEVRELVNFLMWLRENDIWMVGFNNDGYDYPILHFIIENQRNINCLDIYRKSMSIINTDWNNRFTHVIWDRDRHVKQVDLLKVHHFDNVAKMTSLKKLEINMRMNSVQELPIKPGTTLSSEQTLTLLSYGSHDVDATTDFFHHSKNALEFREGLSEKYNKNMMSFNDGKIGNEYIIDALEKHMPGCCYDTSTGKKEKRQTHRARINFKDVIFPYIHFNHPEFQRILTWFQNNSIAGTNTKGAFKLDCTVEGFRFDFGTGGIHGSVNSQIVRSDDYWIIEDWDVKSYYPNLGIRNRLFPQHLSEKFCDIYEEIYELRKTFTKAQAENKMLKDALNIAYGKSNSLYSPFYDPQYTMAITINGQLSLCMLAENLIPGGIQMIQANTDGITIKYPRQLKDWVHSVCHWWERLTKLELESIEYRNMYIRDVNNYIGEYMDGEVKRKGTYCHVIPMEDPNTQEKPWHKNHSALVVPKAVCAHLLHGTDVRQFIENHDNKFDFMLSIKVPRSGVLVTSDQGDDTQVQNVCRYYISMMGQDLVKILPPTPKQIKVGPQSVTTFLNKRGKEFIAKSHADHARARHHDYKLVKEEMVYSQDRRFNQQSGWRVTICNEIEDFDIDEVEFTWYIKEAYKLINPLRKDVECTTSPT